MSKKPIRVFEHDRLRVGDPGFDQDMFNALEVFRGSTPNFPFYSLGNKTILFCEYVGVIQVGDQSIEVLPKIDRDEEGEAAENRWHDVLLEMLRFTRTVSPQSFQDANLKTKHNSILALYFDLFLDEVQVLLRTGLIRQYRQNEGNLTALKGALVFGKHIQQNIVHKERFYTRHTVYSREHLPHQILFECLHLIRSLNHNLAITDRLNRVLFDFPEQTRLKVRASHFDRIQKSRKTEPYTEALKIAKMLLLNYRPDITHGHEPMMSLMFDMNALWEEFILKSIRRSKKADVVKKEPQFKYWSGEGLGRKMLKPDIYIELEDETRIILETKWKTPWNSKPNDADLRQLLAYSHFYDAKAAYLVYPSKKLLKPIDGKFANSKYHEPISYEGAHGGVLRLNILNAYGKLNLKVGKVLIDELEKSKVFGVA